MKNYQPKRLAVKLNYKAEQSVLSGHPWVFSKSIIKINTGAKTGDLAIIFSKAKNKCIGLGLYDANSPIRIKILHYGYNQIRVDTNFFNNRIEAAYTKRLPLLKTNTNSYRLIFGENDGFPGLIADVYNTVLVVKLYSEIWLPYLESIIFGLKQRSNTTTGVLRLSRLLQKSDTCSYTDGTVIYGTLTSETVNFLEHGVLFSANVIKGHKTGYFLDHRENRRQVGVWSKGKTVLDVFAYAGGFSVHALANGATSVTSVDISKQAMDLAKANGKLNPYTGTHITIVGDAFNELQKLIARNTKYDVVVIDPPSFAKQQSEIDLAEKKYAQLAHLGIQLTAKNGLLVLASCSSRITTEVFYNINAEVLAAQHKPYVVQLQTQHDIDHPVSFPEGAYLKCAYYRFLD